MGLGISGLVEVGAEYIGIVLVIGINQEVMSLALAVESNQFGGIEYLLVEYVSAPSVCPDRVAIAVEVRLSGKVDGCQTRINIGQVIFGLGRDYGISVVMYHLRVAVAEVSRCTVNPVAEGLKILGYQPLCSVMAFARSTAVSLVDTCR